MELIDEEIKEVVEGAVCQIIENTKLRQSYYESDKYLQPFLEKLVREIKEIFNKCGRRMYERERDETSREERVDNTSEEKISG